MSANEAVTKSLDAFEIKDEEKGLVESVIATLDVIDKDRDIIRPNAIADGSKVVMSSYGHDTMRAGVAPVGKGTISIEGNKAVFRGKMFMDTQAGRDTFTVLKEMGADQQWSFGFDVLGAEVPTEQERKQGAYRILTKLDAFEVSPVVVGAGKGTRTVALKSVEPEPETPEPEPIPEPVKRDVGLEARVRRVLHSIRK